MRAELSDLLRQIPRGRVTTYGALARALGDVAASRWVGHFMLHHDHGPQCPCHRVVRAGGLLGLYISGNVEDKARRLQQEGVDVASGTVDPERCGFDRFRSTRPLCRLRSIQEKLLEKLSLRTGVRRPRLAAGVDVSYIGESRGVAAYALVEAATGNLLWSTTVIRPIRFPYITSYLAFRELPILLDLLDEVRRKGRRADLLLVDGSGIMHPRGTGIASQLGIVLGTPTVGVTKTLLYGKVDSAGVVVGRAAPVFDGRRKIGVALRPRPASRRLIYVSPGHLTSVASAAGVVGRLLRGRRLPEPIYWADRLSRRAARAEAVGGRGGCAGRPGPTARHGPDRSD